MSHKVPTNLRLLRGNPGKRPLPKNEPRPERPSEVPEPPDWLDDYGSAEWARVAPGLWRTGLLTEPDVGTLAAYCFSYAQLRTAAEILKRMRENDAGGLRGLIVSTKDKGTTPNPLVWIANAAAKNMNRFAIEIGMTPQAGSGLKAPTPGRASLTDCWLDEEPPWRATGG
jgi:P27 family predicted phage terminase small subunit